MAYEFTESKILQSLEYYFAMPASKVRTFFSKEEAKLEEKEGHVTKKEARTLLRRLRLFTTIGMQKIKDKLPLEELINLCHQEVSVSEGKIFKPQDSDPANSYASGLGIFGQVAAELSNSISALKNLTRRVRINLIYD